MKKYFTFLLVLCFIVIYAQQDDIKTLTTKAEQGNAEAEYSLGAAYYNERGVKRSYEKAVYWFTKAAEQGNADGQNSLGACYEKGDGVEQSYEKAVYWFTKAVEQENLYAQFNRNVLLFGQWCKAIL